MLFGEGDRKASVAEVTFSSKFSWKREGLGSSG